MASATGIARDKQQNRSKEVKSTEITTISGYSRVVVTYNDGSKLFAYGSDEQARMV